MRDLGEVCRLPSVATLTSVSSAMSAIFLLLQILSANLLLFQEKRRRDGPAN
jgi:hypothetical protein